MYILNAASHEAEKLKLHKEGIKSVKFYQCVFLWSDQFNFLFINI